MASRSVAPALVLLLLARPAAGQTQTQTPYGAMVLSTYPNGVGRNPMGEPPGYVPSAVNAAGTAATSWVLASQASQSTLTTATSGQVRRTATVLQRAAARPCCTERRSKCWRGEFWRGHVSLDCGNARGPAALRASGAAVAQGSAMRRRAAPGPGSRDAVPRSAGVSGYTCRKRDVVGRSARTSALRRPR